VDGSYHTILSLDDGGLMLEDTKTAMGKLEPLVRFGSSAFGPVRVRAMSAAGVTATAAPWDAGSPRTSRTALPHAVPSCTLTGRIFFWLRHWSYAGPGRSSGVPPDLRGPT